VTNHNRHSEKKRWRPVKAKVVARFGAITAAARAIGCHPNPVRYAQSGLCPKVKNKLELAIAEPSRAKP